MRRQSRRLWQLFGAGLLASLTGCLTATPDGPSLPRETRYLPDPIPVSAVSRGQVPQLDPKPVPPTPTSSPPIQIPPELPGADRPLPNLPPDTPKTRPERLKLIDELFPKMPDLGPDPLVDGTPGTPAVTLEELLEFAKRHSPLIAQAVADVEFQRGQWVQAGLYPNPTIGAQGDQIADLGPFGQFGGFLNQTIPVNGRLRLARAVAYYDFLNAQLRLRKAEADLCRQVRSDFYAVLVAAENVRIGRLVAEFTAEVYRRQVSMVRGGTSGAFEAAALRAVVGQSRANLIQARNRYVSGWKQLAATLNATNMPPAPLAGRVDAILPHYHYEALRQVMLAVHTDLAAARNLVTQAERSLLLERRRPVPDVQNNFYLQRDTLARSQGQPSLQFGYQVGFTVPVFNRNQGAIAAATAQVFRFTRESERVGNDLTRQLADAFERYETARAQVALYRDQILPDLARAFRGVYQRYEVEPDKVNYNDIVNAQQNLANQLVNYLQALQQQWLAVSDLGGLVQTCDLGSLAKHATGDTPDTWPQTAPAPMPAPVPMHAPAPMPVPMKQ